MISHEKLVDLFCRRLEELSVENGLNVQERERIQTMFVQAMKNPFMDERRIYPGLIGKEPVDR